MYLSLEENIGPSEALIKLFGRNDRSCGHCFKFCISNDFIGIFDLTFLLGS